ncbi:hypothetical protein ABNR98_004415 [Salmonella enterica]
MSRTIDQLKESVLAEVLSSVIDLQNSINQLPEELDKSLIKFADSLEIAEKSFNSMKEENERLLKNQSNDALEKIKSNIEKEVTHIIKSQGVNKKSSFMPYITTAVISIIISCVGVFSGTMLFKAEIDQLQKDSMTLKLQDKAINELPPEIRRQISVEYAKQLDKL